MRANNSNKVNHAVKEETVNMNATQVEEPEDITWSTPQFDMAFIILMMVISVVLGFACCKAIDVLCDTILVTKAEAMENSSVNVEANTIDTLLATAEPAPENKAADEIITSATNNIIHIPEYMTWDKSELISAYYANKWTGEMIVACKPSGTFTIASYEDDALWIDNENVTGISSEYRRIYDLIINHLNLFTYSYAENGYFNIVNLADITNDDNDTKTFVSIDLHDEMIVNNKPTGIFISKVLRDAK